MKDMNQNGYLDYFIPKFRKLVQAISFDYHIVIYENDSTDGTREKLLELLHNDTRVTLIFEDAAPRPRSALTDYKNGTVFHNKKVGLLSKERTTIIARSRNQVLRHVQTHYNKNFDYFAMVDMDGVCGGPDLTLSYDPAIFQYALTQLSDQFDALFFRFEPYYDLWAFRHKVYAPVDYWLGGGKKKNLIKTPNDLAPIFRNLSWPDGLLEVESAFEMFGIYKMNVIANEHVAYSGIDNDTDGQQLRAQCEHVGLHKSIQQQSSNNATSRLRLSRLVYCQGDPDYQPLPASLTQRWSNVLSFSNRTDVPPLLDGNERNNNHPSTAAGAEIIRLRNQVWDGPFW